MRYRVRAPLRVDLAGTWTDDPLYSEHEGGELVTAAITEYVIGTLAQPERSVLSRLRGDRSYVDLRADLPLGAGLGVSSARLVAWVALLKAATANVWDRVQVAEAACRVGSMLDIIDGTGEGYASALGGVQSLTFGPRVGAERLDGPVVDELRRQLILVDRGEPLVPRTAFAAIRDLYRSGDRPARQFLATSKRVAGEMTSALRTNNLDALGILLAEAGSAQIAFSAPLGLEDIRGLIDTVRRLGGVGGKPVGRQGRYLLFFTDGQPRDQVVRGLRDAGFDVLETGIDTYGVHLTKG